VIHIFSHYVPGRSLILAMLEAAVSLVAAQIGISLHIADSGAAISSLGATAPAQAATFAAGMMIIMTSMGLYASDMWSNAGAIRVRLVASFVVGFAAIALVSSLVPSRFPGLVALGAAVTALALAGSYVVRSVFHRWNDLGVLKSRVLVLGTGSRVAGLAEHSRRSPSHQVVGFVSLQSSQHFVPQSQVLPIAPGATLASVVDKHAIDKIVVGIRDRRGGGFPVQQLLECKMKGVEVVELPTFFEREYRQVMLESLNPSWMVLGDGFRQSFFGNWVKRLFDLTVSAALLVLCFPVLLVAALCIFLENGLPVLYRQERVGRSGRVFTLYKLRSMKTDAERNGAAQWARENDTRITRVGQILRKCRIDELPQIINVFKGEMSFVGPRPERPYFVDQLVKQVPYYSLRHTVKPGITGWAQVRYAYGASVDDSIEKLQHDLYYVKNHSLFLDIMILLATVEVVLWGKGAR
jgi:sugar transferase (PEP-CTERM system associated)